MFDEVLNRYPPQPSSLSCSKCMNVKSFRAHVEEMYKKITPLERMLNDVSRPLSAFESHSPSGEVE